MKIDRRKLLSTIVFLSLALPGAVLAGEPARPDGLVLHADSLTYEKADDTYRAKGNVHLEWDGMKLVADSALLRQTENTAEAEGNVSLTKDDDTMRADRITLNYETEKGEITNGYFFMKRGNIHVRGAKIEKVGPEDYRISKGSFTTCDGAVPSWKFSATGLKIILGEYATGTNALFYIKDVPVLYLPYVVFPLRKERQSGFLLPKVGTSTKKGINFNIPYYLVISPSQDLTLNLDIQSKRGAGTQLDYRYIRRSGSEGEFRGYLIYDTKRDRFRGDLSQRHLEDFSPTLTLKSDINYVSDHDFYRDYVEAFGEYNRKSVDSNVFLTKHWSRFLLTPELRFSQNLDAPSNVATFQKLPLVTFTGIKQKMGGLPLYTALDSTFTNFYREEGFQGQRIDVHPSLLVYTKSAIGLEGSLWGGYQHRFYNMYDGTGGDSFGDAGLFDAGASLSTTLSRVYDTGWGKLKKLRHTLIPEVGYTYVQSEDQEGLPFFDFNDRVVHENAIGYSVTNYFTGKFLDGDAPAVYRDLAYLRLSQRYDLSGSRRDLLTLYDELHPFNDIRIEARINPVRHVYFETDSRFNPYRLNFSTANVVVGLEDERGSYVTTGYRFTRTQFDYLEGRVGIALVQPFIFRFDGRYSIDSGAFLESYYSLEYKQQCWSVTFAYGERQGNKSFTINFALAGIGSLGRIGAF